MRLSVVLLMLLAATARVGAHPEIEAALARINAQLSSAPNDPSLFLERGELYARHTDWVSAEANYLRAHELSPHLPGLDRARGALALATGQPEEARGLLDTAIRRQPRDVTAYLLRARARKALDDSAGALADFNAALALIPTPSPELLLERAALLDAPAAIVALDDAIARIGPTPSLLLRAATLEESLGRIDAAARRFERLAAQSERQERWQKLRGDLLARAGRPAEARLAYAAALAALSALPPWLQESPECVRLATELTRLSALAP
jgi:tetratricopeptide (TPR) repeat protein